MRQNKIPGTYIEETPNLPLAITSVETAIPAFIGYTEKAKSKESHNLKYKPWRIQSMLEYETYFGVADPEKGIEITFDNLGNKLNVTGTVNAKLRSHYILYYSLQLFFNNGGGPCWIVSVGDYVATAGKIMNRDLRRGLKEVEKIDEITLILFPDAINLRKGADYYVLYKDAIDQCVKLADRFTVMDVFHDPNNQVRWKGDIDFLRANLPNDTSKLKYAAAYFPKIYTKIDFKTTNDLVKVISKGAGDLPRTLAELKLSNNVYFDMAQGALNAIEMLLPVSPAVAGIYAQVDRARGVWKAPANVNIDSATRPEYLLTPQDQQDLNVDPLAGKSINVIRTFPGRGPAIIWGARTLAGNDNEWRYISVRRYFNMAEESIKNATKQHVFEPNNINTWQKVKSIIENYLTLQWKSGALMGVSTKDAFFVHIGLGATITELDIAEGRMIIEIGMALVRPAEFIILRFTHKMLQDY
jgi:phage tail sheath protein FI